MTVQVCKFDNEGSVLDPTLASSRSVAIRDQSRGDSTDTSPPIIRFTRCGFRLTRAIRGARLRAYGYKLQLIRHTCFIIRTTILYVSLFYDTFFFEKYLFFLSKSCKGNLGEETRIS
uniref:Uncharacterized protein n=1 Tax=Pararge aegeria TaxID=116150 RepID=S4P5L4_9NEOP